jgi:hypothetical protein
MLETPAGFLPLGEALEQLQETRDFRDVKLIGVVLSVRKSDSRIRGQGMLIDPELESD